MLLIVFTILFSGCAQQEQKTTAEKITFLLKTSDPAKDTYTAVETTKGTNAFESIKNSGVQLKYEASSFGVFITQIDDLKPAQGEYIAIYIDGNYAQTGILEIYPEDGSELEFRIEKIN